MSFSVSEFITEPLNVWLWLMELGYNVWYCTILHSILWPLHVTGLASCRIDEHLNVVSRRTSSHQDGHEYWTPPRDSRHRARARLCTVSISVQPRKRQNLDIVRILKLHRKRKIQHSLQDLQICKYLNTFVVLYFENLLTYICVWLRFFKNKLRTNLANFDYIYM